MRKRLIRGHTGRPIRDRRRPGFAGYGYNAAPLHLGVRGTPLGVRGTPLGHERDSTGHERDSPLHARVSPPISHFFMVLGGIVPPKYIFLA